MEHSPILPAGASLSALERFLPSEAGTLPLIAAAAVLRGFNREQLGSAVDVLIALMDIADGDPDAEIEDPGGEAVPVIDDPDLPPLEDEGDLDLEQTRDEDDWYDHGATLGDRAWGAGCPFSDPGGAAVGEDDEEDDDAGQSTEDEVSYGDPAFGSRGPGCPISDPDFGTEDVGELDDSDLGVFPRYGIDQRRTPLFHEMVLAERALVKPHRNRIRRGACEKLPHPDLHGRTHRLIV